MLFEKQIARKPDLYPWTREFIHRIWFTQWFPTEFDFKSDYSQFKTVMTEEQKRIIVKTLSAIGQVEIDVKEFWSQLGKRFPHPSLSDLGFEMAHTEVVHNIAYETLLDKLHLTKVFQENLQEPSLQGRVSYLKKHLGKVYDDDKKQQVYALILFTLFVENVSLFSQFYVILYFNRFLNVLKDTAQQVQYTRNEEMLHAQVGIKLINTLRQEYPELFDAQLDAKVIEEVHSAVEAESKIIDWMVGDYEDEHLSAAILKEFIKKRINDSLVQIGYSQILPTNSLILDKTLWLEEETIGNNMSDFFFKKPVEYSKKNKVFSEEDLFD